MKVVRVKPGVQFAVIAPAGFEILAALVECAEHHQVDFTITSGTDSHSLPDPHAKGEAYDVSVAGFDDDAIIALQQTVRAGLGPLFTVLYETPTPPLHPELARIAYVNPHATAPHFHIQLKNGVQYAPAPPASSTTRSA